MYPSEYEIEGAIDRMKESPARFEKLAARWAAIAYGSRFENMVITGRKGNVVTTKWPDAFTERGAALDCIEATHSPGWHSHLLKKDLPRIEKRDICGFVMVAWCDHPEGDTVNDARKLVAAAGVPAKRIDFVFRGRLLNDLQQRRYAHLWHDPLGVDFAPSPFRPVSVARGLAKDDAEAEKLHPSPAEFLAESVYEPAAVGLIDQELDERRFAHVQGLGATGKTVLAEHIAYRHITVGAPELVGGSDEDEGAPKVLTAQPAYYLKLGSYEKHSGQDLEAVFTRLDAENALFVVDDIHLNPHAAKTLRRVWEERTTGSKLLQLGRAIEIDERGPAGKDDPYFLTVRAEDLVGVYKRLAWLEARRVPETPDKATTAKWLELFKGDLIAFGVAVMERLTRLLDVNEDDDLDPADAAASVRERYLDGLDERERADLLCLATLAEAELGVSATLVRNGMDSARQRGAALLIRASWNDGEFQLIHSGLGRLLIAAAAEEPPWDELVAWSARDPDLGLSLGAHAWGENKSDLSERLWGAALSSGPRFGSALFALPGGTIDTVLEGLEVLGLANNAKLDLVLSEGAAAIADSMVDNPASIARTLETIRETYPATHEALFASFAMGRAGRLIRRAVSVDQGVTSHRIGSWLAADPSFANLLASSLADPKTFVATIAASDDLAVLFGSRQTQQLFESMVSFGDSLTAALATDPDLASTISRGVLLGKSDHIPKAVRLLSRSSPELSAELRRLMLDPNEPDPWEDPGALAPIQLLGLLKFAKGISPALLARLEASVSTGARQRLASALASQPRAFLDFEANTEIELVVELTAAARALGVSVDALERIAHAQRPRRRPQSIIAARLEEEPAEAMRIDLARVLHFITAKHETTAAKEAALETSAVLTATENRDAVIVSALQLTPNSFFKMMAWAQTADPRLTRGLLAKLRREQTLSAFADSWVELATLADIAGVMKLLTEADPALAASFGATITAPERVGRLVDRALHGEPSAWAGVLDHESVADNLLDAVDERRWHRYWHSREPEEPNWLASLESSLGKSKRGHLQAAPAEFVLIATGPEQWREPYVKLAQLSNALAHGNGAGEAAIEGFLDRIGGADLLDRQYTNASLWSIARFLHRTHSRLTPASFATLTTDGLWARLRREARIPWEVRKLEDVTGYLALFGALRLTGLPTSSRRPPAPLARAALESQQRWNQLIASDVLCWVGLRVAVYKSGKELRLDDSPALPETLALFRASEPSDPASQATNASMIAWLERGISRAGLLEPRDLDPFPAG